MYIFIAWILGAIAAYRLWGDAIWLSVVVILLAFTLGVHADERQEHQKTGMYSSITAHRLMLTSILIGIIFFYSLFV